METRTQRPTGASTPYDHRSDGGQSRSGDVTEQATHLAEQARQQVQTQLAGQKDQATERLGHITNALRQTSDNLREQDETSIAGFVDQAAHQVEHLSNYLRHHTVGELLGEAERFARREPAMFLGGALLLGLAGARFFKSSSPGHGSYGSSDRYDREQPFYAGPPRTEPAPYPPTYPTPQARVVTPATVGVGGVTPEQRTPGTDGSRRNG